MIEGGAQSTSWISGAVATLLILVAVVLSLALYRQRVELLQQQCLTAELAMMRSVLLHAYHRQGAWPEEIPLALDPFGKPYRYDVHSGWVNSRAVGYETW